MKYVVCVDFYCSEEDMYRDAEEIEREKLLLCKTSSSGTFKLCFKCTITINSSTYLWWFDTLVSKGFHAQMSVCNRSYL